MKINLGCGNKKMDGFINIDAEESCNPDIRLNFIDDTLPFADSSVSVVVLNNSLQYVRKQDHDMLFQDICRVLIPKGELVITFPDIRLITHYWASNKMQGRHIWEEILYGTQHHEHDYVLCALDSTDLTDKLVGLGFHKFEYLRDDIFCGIVAHRNYHYMDFVAKELQTLYDKS